MPTKKAREFISKHIRKELLAGVKRKQAIAISLSKARKRGFKV